MRLGIAGYHRGFELKEKIAAELKLPEYRRAASQQGVDRFFVKDSLDWKEIEEFVQSTPKYNQWRRGKLPRLGSYTFMSSIRSL